MKEKRRNIEENTKEGRRNQQGENKERVLYIQERIYSSSCLKGRGTDTRKKEGRKKEARRKTEGRK